MWRALTKEDASMKIYNEEEHMYLETDASGVGLGASLPKVRDGMNCPNYTASDNTIPQQIGSARKILSSLESHYSSIERGACGILHDWGLFHHYCYARVVNVITSSQIMNHW